MRGLNNISSQKTAPSFLHNNSNNETLLINASGYLWSGSIGVHSLNTTLNSIISPWLELNRGPAFYPICTCVLLQPHSLFMIERVYLGNWHHVAHHTGIKRPLPFPATQPTCCPSLVVIRDKHWCNLVSHKSCFSDCIFICLHLELLLNLEQGVFQPWVVIKAILLLISIDYEAFRIVLLFWFHFVHFVHFAHFFSWKKKRKFFAKRVSIKRTRIRFGHFESPISAKRR